MKIIISCQNCLESSYISIPSADHDVIYLKEKYFLHCGFCGANWWLTLKGKWEAIASNKEIAEFAQAVDQKL
jgi:hypothetical protein